MKNTIIEKFLRRSLTENIYSIYVTIFLDQEKMIEQLSILKVVNAVTQLLASSNSSMNPFIYGKIKAGKTTNSGQSFEKNDAKSWQKFSKKLSKKIVQKNCPRSIKKI